MQRIITDPSQIGSLAFAQVDEPKPLPHQCLIKVTHYSLNRGEIVMAQHSEKGRALGWDYVGTIAQTAADGSGSPEGTRVVGWRPEMDAFAEYAIGDPNYFAPIRDRVTDAQAATLPVAGLTALAALDKGTRLVGNSVLVTGVTGGVGYFALQLAKLSGARAVAQVRKAEQVEFARSVGADRVVVTSDGTGLEAEGPYRLVIDGVGGSMFGRLLENTAKGGTLVSYGVSGGNELQIAPHPALFGNGGQRSIYGLTLYTEAELEPSSIALGRLLRLVADGKLKVPEIVEGNWSETPRYAQDLLDRKFVGKAVLTVS
ncbi:MAG: zinc-binding dehydrogenase [Cyanobacteriota bacterium]|nr:zinc-binding dehydrogenase [Cyanobacteriota bacterium]